MLAESRTGNGVFCGVRISEPLELVIFFTESKCYWKSRA